MKLTFYKLILYLKKKIPLIIATTNIKYLGINLTTNVYDLEQNYSEA